MEENKEILSKEQVWDVINFANNLSGINNNFGIYTPQLLNQNLIGLNNNAKIPNYDLIVKSLQDYKYSGNELQGFSEYMEVWDSIYSRAVDYYTNLLSFDLQVTCKNAKPEDYKTNKYLADKRRVWKFLDNFNYKDEFRRCVKEMLRHETHFVWLRNNMDKNNTKYTLQTLPQNRCVLTGYSEFCLLFDFDMSYFLQAGVSIDGFAPIFKKYFNETFNAEGVNKYIPTNQFNKRNGTFAMYTQTSPDDGDGGGAYCFKFDYGNFNTTPYLAPLLKTAIRDEEMANLQRDKNMLESYAIIYGEMKMIDGAKSGEKSDNFAVTPKTLGQLMSLITRGLNKNIKTAAFPLEEVEFKQFSDSNPSMAETQFKQTAANAASASRVIYSTDKMSNAELEAAVTADYNLVRKLYSQFNNFLEYYVNKKTSTFKFAFEFDGCTQPFERKNRIDNIMKFAEIGMVLNPSCYASALGMKPQSFERALEEGHNGEFLNNLSMMMSIHTASVKDSGGRPQKDDSELSSSGEANRNS